MCDQNVHSGRDHGAERGDGILIESVPEQQRAQTLVGGAADEGGDDFR